MTLKARLLVGMGVVALLLVAAAVTVTRTTTAHLVDQVDDQLLRFAGGEGRGPRLPEGDGGRRPGEDDELFTTLYVGSYADGVLTTRIAPDRGDESPAVPQLDLGTVERLAREGGLATVGSDRDGVRYRVLVVTDPWSGETAVLGLQLGDVDDAVARLVVVELATTSAVLVVLALITWWVLHLGVRPIRRMTATASTIAAGDLSARIPDAPAGTEAAELGTSLNTMLERIEEAFDERTASEDRLRRFVADASHELRTPVTTIRGYAELYRLGGLEGPGQLDAAMGRTEAESVRMGRLVEDLLALARLDQGQEEPRSPVRLDEVAAAATADLAVVHPDHPVTVDLSPATVVGTADQLHQVVANLCANAAVHTPPGTPVRVTVTTAGDVVRCEVADRGPGMDDDTAARAFERFYRADPSRSRASGGSGLGLSIVAAIVASHGGTLRLRPTAPGEADPGTTVVVELPAAPGPTA